MGAVLPFISVLTAPDRVFRHPVVADIAQVWGITSADQLVFPLTIAFAAAALLAGAIRILLLWVSTRLAYASGADLSIEVYRRTLYQPYQVHVTRNSSEVISGIMNKIDTVVYKVLLQLLILVSAIVMQMSIILVLIAIDPVVASIAAIGSGVSYGLITWMSRRRLLRNSQRVAYGQTQVVKVIQEGLGGIRDVLLHGLQQVYCDVYREADNSLRRAQGNNIFIGGSPRFAMEAFGIVLISALAYGLGRGERGITEILPILGALALGAQRLLPAMQQSYNAWTNISGSHTSLYDAVELLDQPLPENGQQSTPGPLSFQDTICFNAVRFRYTSDGPWVLDDLNLTIPKGSLIGFVGSTGSGKSTTLDLLMALLLPTEGELLVDGQAIRGKHVQTWQQTIAHVPQSIYLADTTLAENIAFGVPRGAIDLEQVEHAARQAQIDDFIVSRPEGYNTFVGERGIRLSGGQRQRIGIARALYRQAKVLIFDEATSALDNTTEKAVIDAIEGLDQDLTIIMIAHRLTTVQHCDFIFMLEQGRVVAQGKYEQILEISPSLQKMANRSKVDR